MATNDLTITQISTLLNSVVAQATGKSNISTVNGADFATVAQMGLKTGYDPLLGAIGQVLGKTIFSIRPYSRKFTGLNVSNQRFGNITRKLNISDSDFQDDDRLPLTDGSSVDMYAVKKPSVLQMNYYGANTYEKYITIFKDQLDTAFSSPDEFAQFMTMITQNSLDMIEQAHETLARMILCNYITGKVVAVNNVIHLCTEYVSTTGATLPEGQTENEYCNLPENYPAFIKWVYGRIASLSSMLTERSTQFNINVAGKEITRHTPYQKQKVYLLASDEYSITSRVIADTFHDSYLKLADHEMVNFWQSIKSPSEINMTPIYLKAADGTLTSPSSAVNAKKVFGVIFDEEALGYTVCNQWQQATPFNARGGYSNLFWHFTDRYWNDFTENGIVLMMD
jgi:hypothetical protein